MRLHSLLALVPVAASTAQALSFTTSWPSQCRPLNITWPVESSRQYPFTVAVMANGFAGESLVARRVAGPAMRVRMGRSRVVLCCGIGIALRVQLSSSVQACMSCSMRKVRSRRRARARAAQRHVRHGGLSSEAARVGADQRSRWTVHPRWSAACADSSLQLKRTTSTRATRAAPRH